MAKSRPKEPIHVNPIVNFVLTSIFMLEVVATLWTLAFGRLPPSIPVEGKSAAIALVVYCIVIFGVINVIKSLSAAIGRPLSRALFVGDPLSKPRTMHKFQDQMWQLAIHVSKTN